jgi:hypothetical protein
MQSIIFDPNSDTITPDGFTIIDTEVEFLKFATSGKSLFIRGHRLCAWAQAFFDSRRISYSEISSPAKRLHENFIELNDDGIKNICAFLGSKANLLETYSAQEILNLSYPAPIWNVIPSVKHAAEWLLWLDNEEVNESFSALIKAITNDWKQTSPDLGEIYAAVDCQTARNTLQKWLGAQITPFIERFGPFPISVPDKWVHILDTSWRKEIIRTNGLFLREFIKTPLDWQFKQMVAVATLDYFENHPDSEHFSSQIYDQIARFVSGSDNARLRKIKPIKPPTIIPEDSESVIKWFTNEYLPFREWQYVTNAKGFYPQVLDIGRQFALWYLDFYPKALISKRDLSFFKSKHLRDQGVDHINLLIILDGLHAIDAKYIMGILLKTRAPQRLELTQNNFCFAPLPTVTDFAKGALVHGVQPAFMKEFELLGFDVSEQQTPVPQLLKSKPGDLLIWRIQDPDRTYHTKNKSSMLKKEIEGQLSTIAQKIVDVANSIPTSVPLKIIVTTDHGRFLGVSKRNVEVPENMQAHGRAAWGKTDITFDKTGYQIKDDLVYLSKDRFGLQSDDAAVILTDSAFINDAYPQEISTHGGLFPEEVVIPWMVFERNVEKPELDVTISGEGRANQPGEATITVLNPSIVDISLIKLELDFGGENCFVFDLSLDVAGLDQGKSGLDIMSWPSSEQIALCKAVAVVRMPDGEEFIVKPSIDKMKVVELYTRDKSLLEGLDL